MYDIYTFLLILFLWWGEGDEDGDKSERERKENQRHVCDTRKKKQTDKTFTEFLPLT